MTELITNLSLADVSPERRANALHELAESVSGLLKERFPTADGYVHQTRRFVRVSERERTKLPGCRLWVRRGNLWGYRIEVVAADPQLNSALVKLTRYTPLNEAFAACAALPAMALAGGLLIYDLINWGTWKDYRDPVLVLLLPPMALGLGIFGILRCLAWPFISRKIDKGQIADETAELRRSLHDSILAAA